MNLRRVRHPRLFHTGQGMDALNYIKTIKSMTSIWDNPSMQAPEEDNSKSRFINKALGDGDSIKLTFNDIHHVTQREDTPDDFKTDDGMQWEFWFTDDEGHERVMNQNSTKGRFFSAMRDAKIEKGESVTITRTGTGIDTYYDVKRVVGVFTPPKPVIEERSETPDITDEIPF